MTEPQFAAEQRLAFGRVAELYHEARPSYPPAAIDAVLDFGSLAPGDRVLDVGAGTGKLTALLAARGLEVLALEPSAEMARVARASCADDERVRVVESEFESWTPDEPRSAVLSAQAWHWLDPARRCGLAHAALSPGGALAAIWSFPDWDRCPLRDPLRDAYRRAAPEVAADFPMHPASAPTRLAGDWDAEIAAAVGFTEPATRIHRWSERYPAPAYTRLLSTHQDHILMGDDRRQALLAGVSAVIEAHGGVLELPLTTFICLARRS
jgi:SAM-dependent methyltransferase